MAHIPNAQPVTKITWSTLDALMHSKNGVYRSAHAVQLGPSRNNGSSNNSGDVCATVWI